MKKKKYFNRVRFLLSCQDQPGIVSTISQFIFEHQGNVVQSDQYTTDPEGGMFFMRIEFDLPDFDQTFFEMRDAFKPIAHRLNMTWQLTSERNTKRMAILVSKENHCLLELLWKWQAQELDCEIGLVISNHPDLRQTVEAYDIPFYYIPVTSETKNEAEKKTDDLIAEHHIDFIVLARYMQILSSSFVSKYPHQIINIHHSFLPAFIGANPYAKAFERGVKLIGATAHYVTDQLDQGPIIDQDILRVNHRYTVDDLRTAGKNIERLTLSRAVSWHVQDKTIVHANKTIVFV